MEMRAVEMSPAERSTLAQLHAFGSVDIAVHAAMNDDVAGFDVGAHAAIRADGQTLSAQGDGAFDFAVHDEVFAARKLAFHDDRLAYGGDFTTAAQGFAAANNGSADAGGAGVTGSDDEPV